MPAVGRLLIKADILNLGEWAVTIDIQWSSRSTSTSPLPPQTTPSMRSPSFSRKTLQPSRQPIGDAEIQSEPTSASKNSTILMDVQRTRSSFMLKSLKSDMEKILVHFCRMQKLQYKQGMNEILAPFMYLKLAGLSTGRCYALFRSFFDQYCLNFYYDKDFNSLEIIFKLVTVTIKYHDPALARYLQNYEIEPQIYCIGWLMTLFASKLSLTLTYTLWQYLAVEKDDYLIFFVIIAIIISRRQEIIQTKSSSIFTVITDLIFKNEAEIVNTFKIALLLRKNTPASLVLFFREHRIFKERSSFQRINYLLKQMDQLSLFLVGPMEVSLRQHFSLGFCDKKCYFCALRQPIRLHYPASAVAQHFPALARFVALSNDVRTMDHSLQFIVVDVRGNKGRKLSPVAGMRVFAIDTGALIEDIQAQFNESFMQARGRQHFLFVLNDFSFEREQTLQTQQFHFCQKLIRILNSYSYCYLSILEGGEAAYGQFLKELRLKSELLNSKLHPVSEYNEEGEEEQGAAEEQGIVGCERVLELSEVVTLQGLYDQQKLHFFEGEDNSADYLLLVTEGFVAWVERNGLLERLLKFIRQHKSIMTHLIEEQYVMDIPFKITTLQSVFRVQKLTARVHHNNCTLFYLLEHPQEGRKNYRRGERRKLWGLALADIVREDLQYGEGLLVRRVGFDSASYDVVKQISVAVKGSYREVIRAKREMEEELRRCDDLNNNIIQEGDFTKKAVVDQTDFDM